MNQDEIDDRLKAAITSGAAVCLFGAGYSRLAKDAQGAPVPTTDELTIEIKSQLSIDADEPASLSEIAGFAEDSPESCIALRQIILSRLTCTKPSEAQGIIARAPWRAIFTTNFDDVLNVLERRNVYACHSRHRREDDPRQQVADLLPSWSCKRSHRNRRKPVFSHKRAKLPTT